MKLVHSIYYHASKGCPEAVPAGLIVVHLGDIADLSDDPKEVAMALTNLGVFDDSAYQIGFTRDTADLVRGSEDNKTFSYVVTNQLMPDWQFDLLAANIDIPIADHSLEYLLETIEDTASEK